MRQGRLVVVAAALVAACAGSAPATTFIPVSVENLARSSLASIVGTIAGIESVALPSGDIDTLVAVRVEEVLSGDLRGATAVTLKERGGTVGDVQQVVFGAPQYRIGERAVLFLTTWPDGSLRTNHLALGKFAIDEQGAGEAVTRQEIGPGTAVIVSGDRFLPGTVTPLKALRAAVTAAGAPRSAAAEPFQVTPPEAGDPSLPREVRDTFTMLGNGRFFQPDTGESLVFLIDQRGDAILGLASGRAAVDGAFAAWTNVAPAAIALIDGGLTDDLTVPSPGANKVRFDDPDSEIPDPVECSGTLGVGGFTSSSSESKFFNGTSFNRAQRGVLTLANGFDGCPTWTQCNVAEVATHEIGHAIGLGHSSENPNEPNAALVDATMYYHAHFDGRCAGVRQDDMDGVSFIYPTQPPPSITTSDPLPGARTFVPYHLEFAAAGGAGAFAWSLVAGGFPGLALSDDGVLSGTPTAFGHTQFKIKATDSAGNSHTKTFNLEVGFGTPTVTATAGLTPTPSLAPTPSFTATPLPTATRTFMATAAPTLTSTQPVTQTPTATRSATITPTQFVTVPGDADCNSAIEPADVRAGIAALFDPTARARCSGSDCNSDGLVSAPDVPCEVRALSSIASP